MKQVSIINLDDPAGKTVGGRRRPINPLATADGLQEFINEQFKESGHRLTPRRGLPLSFSRRGRRMDEEFDTTEEGLTSRAPQQKDLAALASELNRLGADYIVIGGFAIIISGYARSTMDLDFIVATDPLRLPPPALPDEGKNPPRKRPRRPPVPPRELCRGDFRQG